MLGASGHSPEELDIDLRWIAEQVGDRPFGVDIIVPAKYVGKDEGGVPRSELRARIPQAHRDFLDDMLRRYDVPELPASTDRGPAATMLRRCPTTRPCRSWTSRSRTRSS